MSRITGTTYQSIVGEVIIQHRKSRSLSQAAFAEKIGMSQSAWSRIEKGHSSLSVGLLTKVATILNVNPHEIIKAADLAKKRFENQGIQVAETKSDATGWLLLGAAAITLVLASKK